MNGVLRQVQIRVLFERYLKFCIVGLSGVVVDMAVLHSLVQFEQTPLWVTLSKVVAAQTAIVTNFILNDGWTFRDRAAVAVVGVYSGKFRRFVRFNLVCLSGTGLGVGILNALVFRIGWNLYLSNLLTIVVVSIWNFALSRRFAWNV
jgi:dolichol-phosphate mannosyltransferase